MLRKKRQTQLAQQSKKAKDRDSLPNFPRGVGTQAKPADEFVTWPGVGFCSFDILAQDIRKKSDKQDHCHHNRVKPLEIQQIGRSGNRKLGRNRRPELKQ